MTPLLEKTTVFEIFASYSHSDASFVKPMVQYLRPTGARVFRDKDNIPPGKKWAAVIASAIEGCRLMYVFWCRHSAASREVQKEYEKAIQLQKDILPVLLDDTPLPKALADYQWVDLRVVIGPQHESIGKVFEERKKPKRGRWFSFPRKKSKADDNAAPPSPRINLDEIPHRQSAIEKGAALLSEKLEERFMKE